MSREGLGDPEVDAPASQAACSECVGLDPRLLAEFVHEMRNQLAPIAHAGDALALLREAPVPVRNAALSIQRQARQVSRLLDRMALAARIFVPDFRLDREPLCLDTLLDEVARDFAALLGGRVEIAPHVAGLVVQASREHLSWTLLELLEMCAARRAPDFGLLLTVRSEEDAVVLGVGEVPADSAPLQAARGAALGVRCAARLVERMGGALRCAFADPHFGDGFRLTLERTDAVQPRAPAALESGARRVLVVDDNRALCDSLTNLVGELGHVARAAATGLDAMSIAILWEPHLVLIDVNLAGTNGYDVALRLRSEFPDSAMQIHMMSGDASGEALAREARRRGLDGFVGKMDCGPFLHRTLSGAAPALPDPP